MAVKTYGDKPLSFQLEENGEYYCIGSEVRLIFMSQNVHQLLSAIHRISIREIAPFIVWENFDDD